MDKEQIMKNLLEINHWSNLEKVFQSHLKEFQHHIGNITLQEEFEKKLKASYYGLFLKECNDDADKQTEDNLLHKLGILKWDLKHKEYMYNNEYTDLTRNRLNNREHYGIEFKCFSELVMKDVPMITEFDNNFTDDPLKVLEEIILSAHCIDIPTVYKKLKFLRVVNAKIAVVDNSVNKFRDLEILCLAGNYLIAIKWEKFPKKLKFLQLFANFITSLCPLTSQIPRGLVFLGLGRNSLDDRSGFHLLRFYMKHLHVLDISNNEIICLESVLSSLCVLPHLQHLSLEGNPCAVVTGYKDAVLCYMDKLKTLDCVLLSPRDFIVNPIYEPTIHNHEAYFVFYCYRIMGLPKPPTDSKNKKTKAITQSWFYVQLEVPLLDPDIRTGKILQAEHRIKSKHKKYRPTTMYDRENEIKSEEFKPSEFKPNEFVSCRKEYSSKIEFPTPTIIIPAPQNDLTALRNTFRSAITVKIMYIVTGEPHVIKTLKSPTTTKRASQFSVRTYENIITKMTLAKFQCHLKQLNWSEKIIDYSWDIKNPEKNEAVIAAEELKYSRFLEKRNSRNASKLKNSVSPIPSFLTVHVGFGLSRLETISKPPIPKLRK